MSVLYRNITFLDYTSKDLVAILKARLKGFDLFHDRILRKVVSEVNSRLFG